MERKKIITSLLLAFILTSFIIPPSASYASKDEYLIEDLAEDPNDHTQNQITTEEQLAKAEKEYKEEQKKNKSVKEKQEFTLDADEVTFDEQNSIATAVGHAIVTDGNTTIIAEKIVYYTDINLVEAYAPSEENEVVIKDKKTELRGKHLRYDANTGRGELTTPHGEADKMYFVATKAISLKHAEAARQGFVAKSRSKRRDPNSSVSVWDNAMMTSCDAARPHYHLKTKRVIVIPGEKTIVKRPRVYYGKRLLFTYPFDMTIGRKNRQLNPAVGYDSDLGVGLGLKGRFDYEEYGKFDIWAMAWFRDTNDPRFETKLRYEIELLDGLSLYGKLNRLYNKRDDVIRWRPEYGLNYKRHGWDMNLRVTKYELLSTRQRIGEESIEHNLSRQPEFTVTTPNIYGGALGKVNLRAVWGKYQEADFGDDDADWIERFGYGVQYTSPSNLKLSIFSPYFGANLMRYKYSSYEKIQQVWNAWVGLNYQIGGFLFNSSYYWRNQQGTSPMSWDRYADNRNFFQSLSFKLPFGDHYNKWFLALRGGYSAVDKRIAEMRYVLTFIRHCMTFQLWCKEYYTNYDIKLGFTFFINAKPEQKISFGGGDDAVYYGVPSSIDM